MGEFDAVVGNAAVLVAGARVLGVPVLVTEQYPRGLGQTVPELAEHLDGIPRLEKVDFSAARADGFDLGGRDQALVCGIETHVCVAQTVADLLDEGLDVQVATDAVSSRTAADRAPGWPRWRRSAPCSPRPRWRCSSCWGARGTPEFKEVQALVK